MEYIEILKNKKSNRIKERENNYVMLKAINLNRKFGDETFFLYI